MASPNNFQCNDPDCQFEAQNLHELILHVDTKRKRLGIGMGPANIRPAKVKKNGSFNRPKVEAGGLGKMTAAKRADEEEAKKKAITAKSVALKKEQKRLAKEEKQAKEQTAAKEPENAKETKEEEAALL